MKYSILKHRQENILINNTFTDIYLDNLLHLKSHFVLYANYVALKNYVYT